MINDSVPVNMKPCSGMRHVQNIGICTMQYAYHICNDIDPGCVCVCGDILVFSSYVGSGPASTVPPPPQKKKKQQQTNRNFKHPQKICKQSVIRDGPCFVRSVREYWSVSP